MRITSSLCYLAGILIAIMVVVTIVSVVASRADAKTAKIMLHPTRVLITGKERAIKLQLKNTGTATGQYRIDLVDVEMPEIGAIKPLPRYQKTDFSARKMLRISPRKITIPAGETQNIRLMIRRPKGLLDGEYRSHVQVRLMNENIDMSKAAKKSAKKSQLEVQTIMSVAIPVIIRKGKTFAKVVLEDVSLDYISKTESPFVSMSILRQGNQSTMGDIIMHYISPKGDRKPLGVFKGIAIYNPTSKKKLSFPLTVPYKSSPGLLHVAYHDREGEHYAKLAESWLKIK